MTNWPWDQLLVLGCAQSCAVALPAVIANISRLRRLFVASQVLILENDSSDATLALLRQWCQHDPGTHVGSLPGLNDQLPIKTERLAHLRNGGMDWMRQRGLLRDSALLLVLDCDEVNAEPWDLQAFTEVLAWFAAQPQAAGVFANQRGLYYDLWALRHPRYGPDDLWERQFALHLQQPQLSDQQLLEAVLQTRRFRLAEQAQPMAVDSAFGGLGFYRGSWLRRLPQAAYVGSRSCWVGAAAEARLIRWQCAEHVAFHAHLRSAGAQLWIHPRLLNWSTPGLRLNPSSWRHLQF